MYSPSSAPSPALPSPLVAALAAVAVLATAVVVPTALDRGAVARVAIRRRPSAAPAATTTTTAPVPAVAVPGRATSKNGVISGVVSLDGGGPVVALTFDDGPDPTWTPQVLRILHEAGIKATFCMIGQSARRYPGLVRQVRDAGHVLCDHTEHHVEHLDKRPAAQIQIEIGAAAADLQALTGQRPAFYRAPGGSLSPAVIGIANRTGMAVLGWSIDPRDWRAKSPDAVLGYLLAGIRPGAIVLLHDGGGNRSATVTQLTELIHTLAARGYRFTTPA